MAKRRELRGQFNRIVAELITFEKRSKLIAIERTGYLMCSNMGDIKIKISNENSKVVNELFDYLEALNYRVENWNNEDVYYFNYNEDDFLDDEDDEEMKCKIWVQIR